MAAPSSTAPGLPERDAALRQDIKASFTALLDAAVDAIVLINEQGLITDFNRAAERMFGYAAAEVVGRNVHLLMPEPYHGEHDGYMQRYLHTGEARIIGIGREVSGRQRDGTVFPIELSVGEIRQEGRRGFVGIIRDVSERKRQEDTLRRQEQELRLVFENAATAIATCDIQGRFLNANQAWVELLGYPLAELRQMNLRALKHPEDVESEQDPIPKLRRGALDSCRMEWRMLRRDHHTIHVLMQAGVVHDARDKPLLMVLELLDRTAAVASMREAGELRERLTHVGRLSTMGEMAAGIAHELNQPLTAIATYAQASRRLIENGAGELPEITGTLGKIAEQAERAGEVIRRLRALLVRQESRREPVDCNGLVRELMPLADLDVHQHGFQLVLALAEDLPTVRADAVQIQQVILNFIRNALDAMLEAATGEQIRVATRRDGDRVEIAVSDSGPGVGAEAAGRLFEPFYTTKGQGLGMGLAICRSIMDAHGGELNFQNNRYGGATFSIRLPV